MDKAETELRLAAALQILQLKKRHQKRLGAAKAPVGEIEDYEIEIVLAQLDVDLLEMQLARLQPAEGAPEA